MIMLYSPREAYTYYSNIGYLYEMIVTKYFHPPEFG